jgi:hypothetical protein
MKNKELKKLAQICLSKDSYHGELYELKDDSKHTYLESGVAISPLDAAICTNEYMETTKY